jgi:hypothetical protein
MKRFTTLALGAVLLSLIGVATGMAQVKRVEMKIDGYLCGNWVFNIQKAVSRLNFAPKLNEIEITDIKNGVGVFTPKAEKPISFAAPGVLTPCHYPNFFTKCVWCILARDSGRQSKALGWSVAEPRYDSDPSSKPAKRAAAVGPISMIMTWRMTKSRRPLRGLDAFIHYIPGVAALTRSTPGSIPPPAPQAEAVNIHYVQKFG